MLLSLELVDLIFSDVVIDLNLRQLNVIGAFWARIGRCYTGAHRCLLRVNIGVADL